MLEAILAAIADLEAGEVEAARARLLALAAVLRVLRHAGADDGVRYSQMLWIAEI